MHVNSACYRLY